VRANNTRKLAAIDIFFLGYKVVFAEYVVGVLFSLALGVFVLFRAHSLWGAALGAYLICLAINYVPMLLYAIAIANEKNAHAEIDAELSERRKAMSKYRGGNAWRSLPMDATAYLTSTVMRIQGWMQHSKRCSPFDSPVTLRSLP
jgi:hypothetical protein